MKGRALATILVLAMATMARAQPASDAGCPCGARAVDTNGDGSGDACHAEVPVTEDNFSDLNCPESAVGKTLPDSDGDGIPDACDRCPCKRNKLDPRTGRYETCATAQPVGPAVAPPAPAFTPAPAPRPPHVTCVGGKVQGLGGRRPLLFLRPGYLFLVPEEKWSAIQSSAGLRVQMLVRLEDWRCTEDSAGGTPTVALVDPRWYGRAAIFAAPSVNGENAYNLELGIDNFAPTKIWSAGAHFQAMSTLGKHLPTTFSLGGGVRGSLYDVIGLMPFVQWDLLHGGAFSWGAQLHFDLGVLEDLGVRTKDAAKLLGK